jgi:hypothetical protein
MEDASLDDFVDSEDERSESSDTASGEGRPASSEADQREASESVSGEAANSEDERSESSEEVSGEGRPANSQADQGEAADKEHEPEAEIIGEGVEPARTTYQWSGAGVECAACGSEVKRRWESEAGPVCPACKEW